MHEALSIPEVDVDSLQGAMSGKAMKTLYWGLINRIEEKWCQWEPALTWMAHAILEIAKTYGFLSNNTEYDIKVENNYPIPEDTEDEIQSDLNKVAQEVMSRASFYKKWIENDAEKAMEELKQIALEKRILEESFDVIDNDYLVGTEGDEE